MRNAQNPSLDRFPDISYTTRRETLNLPGGSSIELELLENLNATIDQVFEILEREGRPELLEVLCPYFGVVWPSARALTEVLNRGSFVQPGLRTLEIGCGLAIPSLRLATQGVTVDATDFHPEVPRFLERNRALNRIHPEQLRYHALDWQQDPEALERFTAAFGPFDRIIGSDILYEAKHAEWVPQVLERLIAPQGKILIADPARPYLQNFVDAMTRLGFASRTEILTAEDRPVPKDVFVIEFQKN